MLGAGNYNTIRWCARPYIVGGLELLRFVDVDKFAKSVIFPYKIPCKSKWLTVILIPRILRYQANVAIHFKTPN